MVKQKWNFIVLRTKWRQVSKNFIKTSKAKICKEKQIAKYLRYLNKLVDQCNNTFHHSINKKSINANYFAFTETVQNNPSTHHFTVNYRVRITKYKNIFSKAYIDSVLKINLWTYEFKDFNGEKIIGSFHENKLLLSKL